MTWKRFSAAMREAAEAVEVAEESDHYPIPEVGCEECSWTGYLYDDRGFLLGPCQCLKREGLKLRIRGYRASVYRTSPEGAGSIGKIDPSRGVLRGVVEEFRRHREKHPQANSILIAGLPGIGKTSAGHYLTEAMMKKFSLPGFFVNARFFGARFSDQVADDRARDFVMRTRREAAEDNVMFFDDLGAERRGSTAGDSLSEMVQLRFERKTPTVITTNLDYKDLADRYGFISIQRMTSGGGWLFSVGPQGRDLRFEGGRADG